MDKLRIDLHWRLQGLADWLWDKGYSRCGSLACIAAGKIFPRWCKDDARQWNGHAQ